MSIINNNNSDDDDTRQGCLIFILLLYSLTQVKVYISRLHMYLLSPLFRTVSGDIIQLDRSSRSRCNHSQIFCLTDHVTVSIHCENSPKLSEPRTAMPKSTLPEYHGSKVLFC